MGKYAPILRIAELGNITRAADDLGYSQSSLSYIASNLEKELGIKIFRRERQGVTPTRAGEELLAIMRDIEALENKLVSTAVAQRTSTFRLGTLPSITTAWVPELLKQFYQKFPKTSVHIIERDNYDDLLTCLQQDELDCTFFAGKHSSAYQSHPLYEDNYYVVVAHDHPLAQQTSVQIEDLFPYSFLPSTRNHNSSPIAGLDRQLSSSCKLSTRLSSDAGVLKLVESGFGFTIFSSLCWTDWPQTRLS